MPKTNKIIEELREKFHIFFVSIGGGTTLNSEEEVVAQYSKIWDWIEKHLSKIEKEARKELIEFILVADSLELLKKNMTKLKKAGE